MAVRLAQAGVLVGVLHYTLYPQARSHAQPHHHPPAPMTLQRVWVPKFPKIRGVSTAIAGPQHSTFSKGSPFRACCQSQVSPHARSFLCMHQLES